METDYFDSLIGQDALKRKLSFYLDAFSKTKRLPFMLFCGSKGFGKTLFAKKVAKHLRGEDGNPRTFLELNCSIIRNNQVFFENIFLQYLHDRPVTVLFDECHNLPKDLSQALLTICNTEKDSVREFNWGDSTFVFDFTKLSFLFATTESDKIFPPLKDRLDHVDFEPYSFNDLKEMVALHSGNIIFEEGVLDEIASHVRGNGRSCSKMSQQVSMYCDSKQKASFNHEDWKDLKHQINILPYGLTNSELTVLRELNSRGACSLNMLASATGQSRGALQRDIEQYLMKLDLIRIDGKRKITNKGQDVLKVVENGA